MGGELLNSEDVVLEEVAKMQRRLFLHWTAWVQPQVPSSIDPKKHAVLYLVGQVLVILRRQVRKCAAKTVLPKLFLGE